jgi:hypothetical protein
MKYSAAGCEGFTAVWLRIQAVLYFETSGNSDVSIKFQKTGFHQYSLAHSLNADMYINIYVSSYQQ